MFGFGPFGRRLTPTGPVADPAVGRYLLGSDLAELAEIARSVSAEYGISSPAVIMANLTRLAGRRVPIRSLTPGVEPGFADLNFADATVVMVRGLHVGDLGLVAVRAQQRRAGLQGFSCSSAGILLELACADRGIDVMVIGLRPGA